MQNSSAFQYLAIDTIHESTTNPRRTFEESKLQELAESIRHHGLSSLSPSAPTRWLRVDRGSAALPCGTASQPARSYRRARKHQPPLGRFFSP